MRARLFKKIPVLSGAVRLPGSKSISNRALIIRSLCDESFEISNLSTAQDTANLHELLIENPSVFDVGPAGTSFRFLTALLAFRNGEQILTGSERMKQRPIAPLVNALRQMGATIEYLEKEGFPPLKIGAPKTTARHRISIPANTSSQFISALLMVAPTLSSGLEIHLEGMVVSRAYIEMTLKMMRYFGVEHEWEGSVIVVPPQRYSPRNLTVENDWSAASYFYSMAAFSEFTELTINGLQTESWQGDAVLMKIMERFGVKTTATEHGISIQKNAIVKPDYFDWNFIECPDLAQTMAVVCAGLNVPGSFRGLDTLQVKETDRVAALQQEVAKIGFRFEALSGESYAFRLSGSLHFGDKVLFHTYDDHRMAMAFATLAMLHPVQIEQPEVVGKSFPEFWEVLRELGFQIES